MSSSIQFRNYILDQLSNLEKINYKSMMGEFLLYYDGKIFGGIYDDRLLIKITNSNKKYLLKEVIPYPSAKPMFLVEEIDSSEYLSRLIKDTYFDLCK